VQTDKTELCHPYKIEIERPQFHAPFRCQRSDQEVRHTEALPFPRGILDPLFHTFPSRIGGE
jgi:hypothetical protein